MLEVLVAEKRADAQDVCVLELVPVDSDTLPPFTAGAHIDVKLSDGSVRQYSLCNHPAEAHRYVIGVLREQQSRGGSAAIHDRVAKGDRLTISEPRNHFGLVRGSRYILFAGGIGVTPILCMAEHLSSESQPFELHYCVRDAKRVAFQNKITSDKFREHIHVHFDNGPAEQRLDMPAAVGTWDANRDVDTHIYICGPRGFIDFVSDAATSQGWPAASIHVEHFSPMPYVKGESDGSFRVRLARDNRIFDIPADRSIASVLIDNGVDIPLSCEQGVCGACVTRIIEGLPEHRDVCLSDAEHESENLFTPCCSRARSQVLILDI
ncbi:PDR/VanB family oxidoreductase [Paraburkholderia caribensis]|uniref:PDR/VanB family oxidoreductase n=1 Tax=Paraburkholderia caribensis TaxID=75105 RepID=A0A9Q6S8P8_9BURK|nr:PDR/VanB family oxidoreductase [Paraburkholderia caribensis]MCO4880104.1 PDR/VanB family oxidoreductase [Paraburkholderia caribensis]PTB26282.1 oxidoreductase [Paraburkholderia caribensis]QLB66548.1 Vanillate O-demethylase oxidoreductase [Paraburkholderia caribensis]